MSEDTVETKEPVNDTVKKTENPVLTPEREWPYRLLGNLVVLAVIGLVAALILTLKNDLVNKKIAAVKESVYDWAGSQGLTLDDIVVSGRNRTTKTEIFKAAGVNRGDNMLKLDVYNIRQKIEQLPWVKYAEVSRGFFPNVLNIRLEEKTVVAIWQLNEVFYPIDEEGKIIDADFRAQEPVWLIVGAKAPDNLAKLWKVIKDSDKAFRARIKVANFISSRRWNLIFDDINTGITVKLPEENIAEAWKKLLNLNETKGILKRKLTIIDLRLPHKVVVKLRKTQGKPPAELNLAAERKT